MIKKGGLLCLVMEAMWEVVEKGLVSLLNDSFVIFLDSISRTTCRLLEEIFSNLCPSKNSSKTSKLEMPLC